MAGRPRKPTAIKDLSGTLEKSRQNLREPNLPPGVPSPPDDLADDERRAWFSFGAILHSMRVLTVADGPYLRQLVETQVEVDELHAEIKKHGRVQKVKTKAGGFFERQRPHVGMLSDARRRLKELLSKGGLSPADRSKVNASEEKAQDPADRYFA